MTAPKAHDNYCPINFTVINTLDNDEEAGKAKNKTS